MSIGAATHFGGGEFSVLFNGQIFDIRISLRTADRQCAREVGAVLTAATGGVKMLLEERVTRRADERPSEIELQAIAKAEFENQRARYCDQQREHPQHHLMHSASNAAYADYYHALIGKPIGRAKQGHVLVSAKPLRCVSHGWGRATGRQLSVQRPPGSI